jgi:hypothetical protein
MLNGADQLQHSRSIYAAEDDRSDQHESALIQIILQFQYITGGDSNPMAFFLLRLAAAKAAA